MVPLGNDHWRSDVPIEEQGTVSVPCRGLDRLVGDVAVRSREATGRGPGRGRRAEGGGGARRRRRAARTRRGRRRRGRPPEGGGRGAPPARSREGRRAGDVRRPPRADGGGTRIGAVAPRPPVNTSWSPPGSARATAPGTSSSRARPPRNPGATGRSATSRHSCRTSRTSVSTSSTFPRSIRSGRPTARVRTTPRRRARTIRAAPGRSDPMRAATPRSIRSSGRSTTSNICWRS